jgi:hypothetical protein
LEELGIIFTEELIPMTGNSKYCVASLQKYMNCKIAHTISLSARRLPVPLIRIFYFLFDPLVRCKNKLRDSALYRREFVICFSKIRIQKKVMKLKFSLVVKIKDSRKILEAEKYCFEIFKGKN